MSRLYVYCCDLCETEMVTHPEGILSMHNDSKHVCKKMCSNHC